MVSSFISVAVLLATATSVVAAPANTNPTATVNGQPIIGTTTRLPSATVGVAKYLGIPFAVTPPQRFLPPDPHPGFTEPFMAQTTPASCLQQFSLGANEEYVFQNVYTGGPIHESEDCLYLNIYTPSTATPSSKLPVMFWIYGGNLQFGWSGLQAYDGSSFATHQNVVLVTINYRTNVFGFSNAPEIPTDQQNAGFYDQRLALQWVSDNIASFGGDPDKITIFGESAGGQSVKQLIAFPPEPLNFRAAIMESEAEVTLPNAAADWQILLTQLGCLTLECAQAANATQIQQIVTQQPLLFGAVNDGKTHVNNPTSQFTSGQAAKVPFLIGNNQNEGNVFAYILGFDDPTASLQAFLAKQFPYDETLQATLAALYAANEVPYAAVSDILTQSEFVCRTADFMNIGNSEGYTMWRYNFNASFPNTQDFPDAQCYHSVEIPEVFGTYLGNNQYGDLTSAQVALSKYMQTAWANFAKNPTEGPGWPEYGSTGTIGNLGAPAAPKGVSLISSTIIDAQCPLYAAVIAAEGP